MRMFQSLVSVFKLAAVLEKYTTKEQLSLVLFLWIKGHNAKDIHKEMFLLFTEGSVCRVNRSQLG
jgi:hypothetical protein